MKYYYRKADIEFIEHYIILDGDKCVSIWYRDDTPFIENRNKWQKFDNPTLSKQKLPIEGSEELTKEQFEKRLFISLL